MRRDSLCTVSACESTPSPDAARLSLQRFFRASDIRARVSAVLRREPSVLESPTQASVFSSNVADALASSSSFRACCIRAIVRSIEAMILQKSVPQPNANQQTRRRSQPTLLR